MGITLQPWEVPEHLKAISQKFVGGLLQLYSATFLKSDFAI